MSSRLYNPTLASQAKAKPRTAQNLTSPARNSEYAGPITRAQSRRRTEIMTEQQLQPSINRTRNVRTSHPNMTRVSQRHGPVPNSERANLVMQNNRSTGRSGTHPPGNVNIVFNIDPRPSSIRMPRLTPRLVNPAPEILDGNAIRDALAAEHALISRQLQISTDFSIATSLSQLPEHLSDQCYTSYGQDKQQVPACIICLREQAILAVRCTSCNQCVGCNTCIREWFNGDGSNHKQCPLCRCEWVSLRVNLRSW